jgi:hypothetical protein
MTFDAYAPSIDPKTLALVRLVGTLAEDAVFALTCGGGAAMLEGLGKRRGEAYAAVIAGHRLNTMLGETDAWTVELTRAMAPLHAPQWLPMAEVLREKVTLEVGARGLRSLFSSKPSEKDAQRVRRLGTLATRVLRAVFAADAPLDPEEHRAVVSLVASLGLPDPEAHALLAEAPVPVEQLDVYGDVEPAISKAIVRGAWLAAAHDQLDPREEHVVRVLGNKLGLPAMDLEVLRSEVVSRVEQRRLLGLAVIDAIRFVLPDRAPGHGVTFAAKAGTLLLPRRARDEALAPIGAGARVVLARRYAQLPSEDREAALAIAWAAALYDDPSVARRALLRARHDRVAADLAEDGLKARSHVETWFMDTLAPAAAPMGGE